MYACPIICHVLNLGPNSKYTGKIQTKNKHLVKMDLKRAPLSSVGNSRIPGPGSRLPLPGSKLRPPGSQVQKRKPSPVAEPPVPEKKSKPDLTAKKKIAVTGQGRKPLGSYGAPGLRPGKLRRSLSTPALSTIRSTQEPATTRRRMNSGSRPASTKPVTKAPSSTSTTAKKTVITTVAPSVKPASTNATAVIGKKRPAWDVKGRLLDMEAAMSNHLAQNSKLQSQVTTNNERIYQLEDINRQLEGTVKQKEQQTSVASMEIETLQRRLRASEEELQTSTRQMQMAIEDEKFARERVERQKAELEGELTAAKHQVAGLQTEVAVLTSSQSTLKAEKDHTQHLLEAALEAGRLKDQQIAELRAVVSRHEKTIEDLNQNAREHETERRHLHNTIQELKGNIRVFCRVRPLLGHECLGNNGIINHMAFPEDQKTLELEKLADTNPNESVANLRRNSDNRYEFKFDQVFGPNSTQGEVFEEISQLVQSALDGYNVCIFAYGQTGSGKTHTMECGASGDYEQRGMIPRTVEQIFLTAKDLQSKGWEYEFEASFLEIYNETIRDLLGEHKEDLKHEIKMVTANSLDVVVTNLTSVLVTQENQVFQLLKKASENRAVAETKCNERSSRSHSVFRLKLMGHNKHTDENCVGLLNLIDLAGSERLKDSQSQGARLTETKSINKSLANLGNVIMALANKDNHIPYRNSKLTHLLQNSLGGNSKTLMFVNISPKEECFQETLCSLRFATKVNNCNIGTAQKRVK